MIDGVAAVGYDPVMYRLSPRRAVCGEFSRSYRPVLRPGVVRRTHGLLAVLLTFLLAACSGNVGSSPSPTFVDFEASIVFLNDSTYSTDPPASQGGLSCSPTRQHADLVVTGFAIFGNPPVSTFRLQGGSIEDGSCVVEVSFPIRDSPGQTVELGCETWFLSGPNVTAEGNWSAGILEYLGCIGLIENPEDWPEDILRASQRLRRDTIDAFAAAGQAATRIESSPDTQQHPLSVERCEGRGITDTDRDSLRLSADQLVALAQYWDDASYDVATAPVDEDGPNDQLVVRASKDGVGVIKLSWRSIGPNGDPFVLEIATACFERDVDSSP